MNSGCTPPGPSVRWTDGGFIEIEGKGVPFKPIGPYTLGYAPLILKWSNTYGVPPGLVAGIFKLESGGNDGWKKGPSFDGGVGPMQITDAGLKGGHTTAELLDPDLSLNIGVKYLATLLDKQHGNIVRAIVSYNAGGAYCGSACFRHSDPSNPKSTCSVRCIPNQWNLVTYCMRPCDEDPRNCTTADSSQSIDYIGDVIAWANSATEALGKGSFSPQAGTEMDKTTAALVFLVGAGAAWYAMTKWPQGQKLARAFR